MNDTTNGSIYESAQECLEDNLPALSTETLIALFTVVSGSGVIWLNAHLEELVESRRNAAPV